MAVGHERTIGSKGHGLWGIPHAQLPAKIQHVYNDLVESGKPVGGFTYRLAVGIVENWAEGHDGKGNKVSTKVQAEAAAAITEWNKLRGEAHARTAAKGAKKVSESKLTDEEGRAARTLLAALDSPALRVRDRATSLTARLLGQRPSDERHARQLLETALEDCGCGGRRELAEAKMGKCPDCGKPVPEALLEKGGKCPHCGDKIKPKGDGDAEDKKDGGKDELTEADSAGDAPQGDSRLAPRRAAQADASRDTLVGAQLKRHSRLAVRTSAPAPYAKPKSH